MPIINIKDGSLCISEVLTIYTNSLYKDVESTLSLYRSWNVGNGYKWLYLDNVNIENLDFNITLCFKSEIINLINFSFYESGKNYQLWNDWSKEKELILRAKYNDWLTENIGTQRVFDWGSIHVNYDIQSSSSSISIKYI